MLDSRGVPLKLLPRIVALPVILEFDNKIGWAPATLRTRPSKHRDLRLIGTLAALPIRDADLEGRHWEWRCRAVMVVK